MRIAALVVTYNRKTLLQKCVDALRNQTRQLDAIIVVNNNSNDGTKEWLDSQPDLIVIHQENVGGAGGFYRGIKEAYERDFDWIWAMDDDVNPSATCLDCLCDYTEEPGILCPMRLMGERIVLGETLKFNLTNPFKPLKRELRLEDISGVETLDIEGMAFEGPLISRKVVEKIGFPNAGLFIFWDDTDYAYRAVLAGFRVRYVPNAILNKEYLSANSISAKAHSWKVPYGLRNLVCFSHTYGKTPLFRNVYPFMVLARYMFGWTKHILKRDGYYKLSDWRMIWQSYRAGVNNVLGKV